MTEPSSSFGRSALSDTQLGAMWNHMQELYPSECERIANPPEDEDEEESKQSTRFIQAYVENIIGWPETGGSGTTSM
jgi:hypothetical protein